LPQRHLEVHRPLDVGTVEQGLATASGDFFNTCPSPKVYARLEALTAARYLDSLRANP